MNKKRVTGSLLATLITSAFLGFTPVAQSQDGSDEAFNQMLGTLRARDTGSQWFDTYVAQVNQDLAQKDSLEPYGAAGPEGPLSGFDGYLNSFAAPDTGSVWFNEYVDRVNRDLREKQRYEEGFY